jgi:hypothetical protein
MGMVEKAEKGMYVVLCAAVAALAVGLVGELFFLLASVVPPKGKPSVAVQFNDNEATVCKQAPDGSFHALITHDAKGKTVVLCNPTRDDLKSAGMEPMAPAP